MSTRKRKKSEHPSQIGWAQFAKTPYFISTVKGLSRIEKGLLAAILHKSLAVASGAPIVRQGELAALTGSYRQKISKPLASLEKKGLIAKENVQTATRFSFPQSLVAALADYPRYMPVPASEALEALDVLAPEVEITEADEERIRAEWPRGMANRPTSLRAGAELALDIIGRPRTINTEALTPAPQPAQTQTQTSTSTRPSTSTSTTTSSPAPAPSPKTSSPTSTSSGPVVLASDDPDYVYVQRRTQPGRYDTVPRSSLSAAAAATVRPAIEMRREASSDDEDEVDFSVSPFFFVPAGDVPAPVRGPAPVAPTSPSTSSPTPSTSKKKKKKKAADSSPAQPSKILKSGRRHVGPDVKAAIDDGIIPVYAHPTRPEMICLVAEVDLPDAEPSWADFYHALPIKAEWTSHPLPTSVVEVTTTEGLIAYRAR